MASGIRLNPQKIFNMKKRILFFAKRKILSGIYQLGKIIGVNKNTVSILCYHGVSENSDKHSLRKEVFENHIKKISNHSSFISMEEALGILNGIKVKGHAVVMSFDDGFANLMNIAPLVLKYRIKPTVFVLSDPKRADRAELCNPEKFLTIEEIKILHNAGWTIGCHSATHANFSNLNQEEIKRQVTDSKFSLEIKLGFKIDYFAYPKGIFDENIINIVKKSGYVSAFSTLPGGILERSNRWILPRTVIDNSHHIDEFPAVYSPTSFFIRKITNRFKIWDRFFNI